MSNKYKELIKNTLFITLGNFSSKILIILLIPLYTKCLSTAEYGLYDLTYTTIQLLFPILTLGITESILNFLLLEKNDSKKVMSTCVFMIFFGTFLFSILILINHIFLIFKDIDKFSILIILFFFFYCLYYCLIQYSKGTEKVKEMTIAGILSTLSILIFNIIFLLIMKIGLNGYFIANVLGYIVPCIYLIIKNKIYISTINNIDMGITKKMIIYSIPLIINTIGWWVNNTSDKYIVTLLFGVSVNGLLSVAYKIPSIISTIGAMFIQAWQISAIKEKDDDSKIFYTKLFIYFNFIVCLISTLLIIFIKLEANIMFKNDFYAAWVFVPYLIISSLFNQISGFEGAILIAKKKSRCMARTALIGIVINVTLNFVLCYLFGAIGITIATMISSFIIYRLRFNSIKNELCNIKINHTYIPWIIIVIAASLILKYDVLILNLVLLLIIVLCFVDIIKSFINFVIYKKEEVS